MIPSCSNTVLYYITLFAPPTPHSPLPPCDATARANTAAGYITAGYITDPDAHGDLQAISTEHWSLRKSQNGQRGAVRPSQAVPGHLALSPVMGQPNARPPLPGGGRDLPLGLTACPQASPGCLWGPRGGLPRPAPTSSSYLFKPIYLSLSEKRVR